jgi:hypothetical protein
MPRRELGADDKAILAAAGVLVVAPAIAFGFQPFFSRALRNPEQAALANRYILGAQAFVAGTTICGVGALAAGYVGAWYFNVSSIRELAQVFKEKVPGAVDRSETLQTMRRFAHWTVDMVPVEKRPKPSAEECAREEKEVEDALTSIAALGYFSWFSSLRQTVIKSSDSETDRIDSSSSSSSSTNSSSSHATDRSP